MQPDNQIDMSALLAQAQQVQQKLMQAQQELSRAEVVGESGGGLVRVTMHGSGGVTEVHIDPKVIDPSDPETLQDLIVGALSDAAAKAAALAQSTLGPLASGMGNSLGI